MTAYSPLTQDAQQKSPKQLKHRPPQQELMKVMTQSLSMNSLVTMQNLQNLKNQIVLKLCHTKESLRPTSEVQNAIMPTKYGLVTFEKSMKIMVN